MIKIVVYIAVGLTAAVWCAETAKPKPRLLFYDEDGNLVKTSTNPYLQNLRLNAGIPLYGNFLNPIFGFIKDFGNIFTFTVPVSSTVIEQIKKDPLYHDQMMVAPAKDPVIAPNPLCNNRRAQIPSPNLCNNYLNCWDGWAVEQECPNGLLFSRQGYCEYSDKVDCETRLRKEQTPPLSPYCKRDFMMFTNPLDCHEFYVCDNRRPVKFRCPEGLAFHEQLGVCEFAERIECPASGIRPSLTPAAPATIPAAPSIPVSSPISAPAAPPAVIPAAPPAVIPAAPSIPVSSPIPAPAAPPAIPDVPSAPTSPQIPSAPVMLPASPQPPSSPALPSLPLVPPMPLLPAALKPNDINTIYSESSVYNTQGWTSINIATSLQDAINQLQRNKLAKIEA